METPETEHSNGAEVIELREVNVQGNIWIWNYHWLPDNTYFIKLCKIMVTKEFLF